MRRLVFFSLSGLFLLFAGLAWWLHPAWGAGAIVFAVLIGYAVVDVVQNGNNVRRNFPLLGRVNEFLEKQRHVPQEILFQTSWEGRPFSRLQQRLVHKRADDSLKNEPFGTEKDYRATGHDWLAHSLYPSRECDDDLRVRIGGPDCAEPYEASILNVAAMSFGSISENAVRALCGGAREGRFAVNTGEGGLTDHHLEPGCDLIWQIGTAYFGCRTKDGDFCPDRFRETSRNPAVKMIEVKISQGAKPGFGAILPASKNTEEIARYRDIEPGEEIISPPHHSAFSDAEGLLAFIGELRELSGGKPVGIKFCLGNQGEFLRLRDAMASARRAPDFITVAGGEGGSGAADLDSVHHVGGPTEEALVFVRDAIDTDDFTSEIKLLVAGKIVSGFDLVRYIALGADAGYSARGMMFALGCVQSLKCNANACPTGITTMDPRLVHGLEPITKAKRVANYHRNTMDGVRSLVLAAGLTRLADLDRHHIERRISESNIEAFSEIYPRPASTP